MKVKGYFDRLKEGKTAVILVEDMGEQFEVDLASLPEGAREGDWFDLVLKDGEIQTIKVDKLYTKERERVVQSKMDQLRKRRGSKFRKNK